MASKPVLTYSSISDFDCPVKFKYRQIGRIRPRVKKESLYVGGLFHFGRECGEETMLERLGEWPAIDQNETDRLAKSEAMLIGMLRAAESKFITPPIYEREPEWLLPIINPDTGRQSKKFMVGGKADALADDGLVNIIIEEKTTSSRPGQSDIEKLALDRQVLNEVSCLQRARGIMVSEVWYRYILKPFIKQKQTESVRQYCDRVIADYAERPEFYLHEERLYIDQASVIAWERDLWRIAQAIEFTKRNDAWYRNTSHCAEWGGCSYLPLCRGEDTEGMYVIEENNPELQEVARVEFTAGEEDQATGED